jgi:hypothetical protein
MVEELGLEQKRRRVLGKKDFAPERHGSFAQ